MTHRALLVEVWGVEYEDDFQVLRAHIANLRRKIEPPDGPQVHPHRPRRRLPLRRLARVHHICIARERATSAHVFTRSVYGRREASCGLDGGGRMIDGRAALRRRSSPIAHRRRPLRPPLLGDRPDRPDMSRARHPHRRRPLRPGRLGAGLRLPGLRAAARGEPLMAQGWLQIAIFVAVLSPWSSRSASTWRASSPTSASSCSPVVGPIERLAYRALRVRPERGPGLEGLRPQPDRLLAASSGSRST